MNRIKVIDSHTEGEPTRLVLDGAPSLGDGSIAERLERFRELFDDWFAPLLREPRAFEAVVGAWIGEPTAEGCLRDVIFFNPAGPLGMCGHGTIGLVASLAYMGEIQPGDHLLNTPAGIVSARLLDQGRVQVENVPSRRAAAQYEIEVPGYGPVVGDISYGGNWFFLVYTPHFVPGQATLEEMTKYAWAIRRALNAHGHPEIDHVELFGPPQLAGAQSKNFVLCPSGEYDRSPCGTGTSAKLACLFADGKLAPGEVYVQESVIGTSFRGWVQDAGDGAVKPTIEGAAYVTGEATLTFDPADPLRQGIQL